MRTYLIILGVTLPTLAQAHISLERANTHLSRYGDAELKAGPCGRAGGTRGTHVYTYQPGQTITVSLVEYIPHPSYFRIAFDDDGDDAFKEPASIKPIDPQRPCPIDSGDHCGASDFFNSPAVLMDNLNPHLAPLGTPTYTWQVKLPDVECSNCTLQIIQVMEDNALHGDYDPTPGVGIEDIYHQCIDLVLTRSAPASDGGAAGSGGGGGSAGAPGGGGGAGGGGGGGGGSGAKPSSGSGCALAGRGAGGASALTLLALAAATLLWRRRRA
jgi:hypothetical protein